MLADTREQAGVEERYEVATNTSRLLLEEHRTGAADVLTSAGMAQQFTAGKAPPPYSMIRTGMALLRLHSEWSSAAKPSRLPAAAVCAIADGMKKQDARHRETADRTGHTYSYPGPPAQRAQEQADRWYASDLRMLANSLKSRGAVWDQLAPWAALKGHDSLTVAEAVLHWLHPVCPKCNGLGMLKVPGQPALSGRQCKPCGATGKRVPGASMGRVLAHLDEAVAKARGSLKKRLRSGERA